MEYESDLSRCCQAIEIVGFKLCNEISEILDYSRIKKEIEQKYFQGEIIDCSEEDWVDTLDMEMQSLECTNMVGFPFFFLSLDKHNDLKAVFDWDANQWIIYQPSLPWERTDFEDSFTCFDDVGRYMADLLMPYAKEGISYEDVLSYIVTNHSED